VTRFFRVREPVARFSEELLRSRTHSNGPTSVDSAYDSVSRDRALQGVGRDVLDHRASSSGG
jgi:hypothetical protein